MKKTLVAVAFAAASLMTVSAYADGSSGAAGAVGGAAVGAVVGGPIGAVVGAGVGGIVGSTLPPQPSVVYDQPVVVGQPLPDSYTYYEVPNQPNYEYVVVNNQRVIVDRHHHVMRVIN